MKPTITLSIILISLLIPAMAPGQSTFSRFVPNAQAIGIGGSNVALAYDPSASYWNPASITFLTTNRVLVNIDHRSYLNHAGFTKFFPPSFALGLNVSRAMMNNYHYDMATVALGYRPFPFLAIGTNVNLSKTMYDDFYSSVGFGLFFKTQPDYRTSSKYNESLWKWFRSRQMRDKFSFGISIHNVALNGNNGDEKKHEIRIGTAIRPHHLGPIVHFASHFYNDEYSLHLGALTPLSEHAAFFMGVTDLNINNFSAGGAISLGAFEVDVSYDFKNSKIYGSLLLRLSDDRNSLHQKYREIGNQQVQNNNYSGALNSYLKALVYDPTDDEVNYLIPVLQNEIGQNSHKIDSLFEVGSMFENKGWYINAFLSYKKIMELDQYNRKARGRLKALNSKLTPYLDQIFRQGVEYFYQPNFKRAQLIFEKILFVNNSHEGAKTYLAKIDSVNTSAANEYYYRGLGYYNQRNFGRAQQEFKNALVFSPNDQMIKEYLTKSEKEIASNNRLINQYLSEAQRYEENKQYAKASISYRKALEIDKTNQYARSRLAFLGNNIKKEVDDKFARAKRLYDDMDYASAVALLQENLSIDPDHQPSQNYLKLANQKLLDLAEQHYQRAQNFFNQKKWDLVLQECNLTLSMNKDHSRSKELQKMALANISQDKLLERGLAYYERNDYLSARSIFRQILEKEPTNITARNYLDRLEAEFSERVEELFNLGMVKYTEGNYDEAIEEWKKIFDIDPNHKSARDYIQKAQERINALKRIE